LAGKRVGRFSLKENRELIALAANGATVTDAAAKFRASVGTIERKAQALGVEFRAEQLTEPKYPLEIRLDADTRLALELAAALGGMSVTQFVETALARVLADAGEKVPATPNAAAPANRGGEIRR
jgi:predicted HicB family RNase H-like nuclease